MATAAKTILNVKTDVQLKAQAKQVASDLGVSLSAVINNYLQEFVREKRVVFEDRYTPNAVTAKKLTEALKDIESGNNIYTFDSLEEADAFLLSDGE